MRTTAKVTGSQGFTTSGLPYNDPKVINVEPHWVARYFDHPAKNIQHVQVDFGYSAKRGGTTGRLPDSYYLTPDEAVLLADALHDAAEALRQTP